MELKGFAKEKQSLGARWMKNAGGMNRLRSIKKAEERPIKKLAVGIGATEIGATLFGAAAVGLAANSSDQAQIKALEERFAKAVEAKDIDAIMG